MMFLLISHPLGTECTITTPGLLVSSCRRLGRDRFETTAQKGDAVCATVLHMSEVRELWEVLHGA